MTQALVIHASRLTSVQLAVLLSVSENFREQKQTDMRIIDAQFLAPVGVYYARLPDQVFGKSFGSQYGLQRRNFNDQRIF